MKRLIAWFKRKTIDPAKHCVTYKRYGCAHVDGYLCEFNNRPMRINQVLFDDMSYIGLPLPYFEEINKESIINKIINLPKPKQYKIEEYGHN